MCFIDGKYRTNIDNTKYTRLVIFGGRYRQILTRIISINYTLHNPGITSVEPGPINWRITVG